MVVHIVNPTSAVGPLQVRVKLAAGVTGRSARLLVRGDSAPISTRDGVATVELTSVLDHEAIVID